MGGSLLHVSAVARGHRPATRQRQTRPHPRTRSRRSERDGHRRGPVTCRGKAWHAVQPAAGRENETAQSKSKITEIKPSGHGARSLRRRSQPTFGERHLRSSVKASAGKTEASPREPHPAGREERRKAAAPSPPGAASRARRSPVRAPSNLNFISGRGGPAARRHSPPLSPNPPPGRASRLRGAPGGLLPAPGRAGSAGHGRAPRAAIFPPPPTPPLPAPPPFSLSSGAGARRAAGPAPPPARAAAMAAAPPDPPGRCGAVGGGGSEGRGRGLPGGPRGGEHAREGGGEGFWGGNPDFGQF